MRRATSVLIGILLGAVAAGLGVGVFLKLANDDRERLAAQLEATMREAQEARAENQTAIEQANQRLLAANSEVGKAQNLIKALEEERQLLASAQPLTPPPTKSTYGWKEAVAIDLGATFKYPTDSAVSSNDARAITLAKSATSGDPRWFSLMAYDERLESEMLAALVSSSPISYLVNGKLLTGSKGTVTGRKEPVLVLRVRSGGQITHLLWAREGAVSSNALMNVLASLRFES